MDFSLLIERMFVFVVLMLIGYLCVRSGYISKSFISDSSKLTLNVFMVATIINSVLGTSMDMDNGALLISVSTLSLTIFICYIIGFVSARILPFPSDKRSASELLISAMNTMFVALPVAQQAYGSKATFLVSISCLPFNAFLYSYGVYRLNSDTGGRFEIRWKNILTPPLIATLAAILLFLIKPPVPGMISELLGTMSAVTTPLSMFVVGASLASVSFFDAFREKLGYVLAFITLIISPLIVWAVFRLFISDPVLLKTCVIIAGSPCGIILSILSIQYNKDYVFPSKVVLLSTVLSMITLPLIVFILG